MHNNIKIETARKEHTMHKIIHVIGVCLPSQSASEKHNQEKKPTNLCVPREFLKQMCLPCLIIIESHYFHYRINKPFTCSLFVI